MVRKTRKYHCPCCRLYYTYLGSLWQLLRNNVGTWKTLKSIDIYFSIILQICATMCMIYFLARSRMLDAFWLVWRLLGMSVNIKIQLDTKVRLNLPRRPPKFEGSGITVPPQRPVDLKIETLNTSPKNVQSLYFHCIYWLHIIVYYIAFENYLLSIHTNIRHRQRILLLHKHPERYK